jgi:hypothetical protein
MCPFLQNVCVGGGKGTSMKDRKEQDYCYEHFTKQSVDAFAEAGERVKKYGGKAGAAAEGAVAD